MDAATWKTIIARLAPAQRALVDELMAMLEKLQAPQLVADEISFERDDGLLAITLPHHTRGDYAVRIEASPRGATIRYGHAVKEIYAFEGYTESRSWSAVVVSFVEDILRGKREVHTTFIGKQVARIEVYEVDGTGQITLLSDDGVPRRTRDWRPFARAMTEVSRISYMEPLAHI